ncbi:MAG: hypothetical protein QGG48_11680 [Desulfatiglandales bacterium]|nr:hypothetical protein [Desulfatiglandales bacterium]
MEIYPDSFFVSGKFYPFEKVDSKFNESIDDVFEACVEHGKLLKEYIAEEIGVDDGEIIVSSKGLHLYDYTWELAKQTAKMI